MDVRFIEAMLANPVDKDAAAEAAAPMRRLFTKSIVSRVALPAGTILEARHLAAKARHRDPAARLHEFIGKRLVRDVRQDEPLTEECKRGQEAGGSGRWSVVSGEVSGARCRGRGRGGGLKTEH